MAATLQELSGGRLEMGIGAGGHPAEHAAMGIPFPEIAERAARLEEAVQALRLLWTGGPVSFQGRFFPLVDVHAFPIPVPVPRIIVGGETPAGARLAGRIADGWTAYDRTFERDLPRCLEALEASGRRREAFATIVAFNLVRDVRPERQPFLADPVGELGRWRRAGADEVIVACARPEHIGPLLAAAAQVRSATS
jgi:alkanesulfonate monooxygenase SsuD/methylene tetrahydromethanopterin reductase-like flavin-dependent oxidoreductase (luciferase family)